MVVTMPSPTRAMMVSSLAPPTKRSRLVRTVTRALTFTWIPSLATPSMVVRPPSGFGQSMTFGSTDVRTASTTLLPEPLVARSIAHARSQPSSMPAFCAAISACTVGTTLPPAWKWEAIWSASMLMPARTAVMRASTISPYGMLANLSATSLDIGIGAPLKSAFTQAPMRLKTMAPRMRTKRPRIAMPMRVRLMKKWWC